MVQEAEKFASEDAARKEQAEVFNQAESTVFQAEKLIRDYKEKLPEDAVKQTEEKIEGVRKAQADNNIPEIKAATEALAQQLQALGAQMYEDVPPAGGAETPNEKANADDEDVIDAEFTET